MNKLGIGAIAAGVLGAAVGGTVAAEKRAVGRARSRPDPFVNEPLGKIHTEGVTVTASDGVHLHAEVDGDLNAPLTIVFVHGFTLSMDCFHFQRRELRDEARLVFYDQRSHGASGRSSRENSTIDQLGRDLKAVLDALVPDGPIVLVGHSMGGMTILALADQQPELFGERIIGVALLSTSSGKLADGLLGMPVFMAKAMRPVVPGLVNSAHRHAARLETGRRAGSDVAFLFTRYVSYGPDVPPSLVAFMEQMLTATPIEVMTEFIDTFLSHDKLTALDVLVEVPTLISCGTRDTLTPMTHSQVMADVLSSAELQVIPGAGHMAIIDRYAVVNGALRRLLARARESAVATRT